MNETDKQIAEDLATHAVGQAKEAVARIIMSAPNKEVAAHIAANVPMMLLLESYGFTYAMSGKTDAAIYKFMGEAAQLLIQSRDRFKDALSGPGGAEGIAAARERIANTFKT